MGLQLLSAVYMYVGNLHIEDAQHSSYRCRHQTLSQLKALTLKETPKILVMC